MDIKEKIEEVTNKIKNDPDLMKKFQENPVQAVEGIIGMDLPDDQVNGLIDAVKAKITVDGVKNILGGILGGKKD